MHPFEIRFNSSLINFAQEKYHLHFKVLQERLKASIEVRSMSNGSSRRQSLGGAEKFVKVSSSFYLSRKTPNQHSGTLRSNSASTLLRNGKMSSRSFDGYSRSTDRDKPIPDPSEKGGMLSGAGEQILGKTVKWEESANERAGRFCIRNVI